MADRYYVDYYHYDEAKVNQLLNSSKIEDKVDGLFYTVLGSNQFERSDTLIRRFIHENDTLLKQNAILCIGHLVRIHKRIDLEYYLSIIETTLISKNQELIEHIEDSLNDIWIFYDRKEKINLAQETIVGRFFNTLSIANDSEIDGDVDGALRKLKSLHDSENDPLVKRIQNKCIENLTFLLKTK